MENNKFIKSNKAEKLLTYGSIILKALYRHCRNIILFNVLRRQDITPYMSFEETVIIEEILGKFKPKKCLEWGTGYSTLLFPGYAGENANWLSVEHDEEWASRIKKMNKNANAIISYAAPNNPSWTDPDHDGAFCDLKDYIEFPGSYGPFDFILVDGRARKDCLIKARDIINDNGIVVLHDADRKYYQQPLELYKYKFSFSDYTGGWIKLWVGSKGININEYIDVYGQVELLQLLKALSKNRTVDLAKVLNEYFYSKIDPPQKPEIFGKYETTSVREQRRQKQ